MADGIDQFSDGHEGLYVFTPLGVCTVQWWECQSRDSGTQGLRFSFLTLGELLSNLLGSLSRVVPISVMVAANSSCLNQYGLSY